MFISTCTYNVIIIIIILIINLFPKGEKETDEAQRPFYAPLLTYLRY